MSFLKLCKSRTLSPSPSRFLNWIFYDLLHESKIARNLAGFLSSTEYRLNELELRRQTLLPKNPKLGHEILNEL